MSQQENAISYIKDLIVKLIPQAKVIDHQLQQYHWNFSVECQGRHVQLEFPFEIIDDFEQAIKTYKDTTYYYGLESDIKFKVYMPLGINGFIPDFDIVKEILVEKRDWIEAREIDIEDDTFSGELSKTIFSGMQKMRAFLVTILTQFGNNVEIDNELNRVNDYIVYYQDNKSFISSRVSVINLGFLKAALIAEIIERVSNKKKTGMPERIKKNLDKEIYALVGETRRNEFINIPLPACIRDYASSQVISPEVYLSGKTQNAKESLGIMLDKTKALIFIACGQLTENEKAIGEKVKIFLSKHNTESFFAEKASSLEDLNSHIFKYLTESSGFLAILHRRYRTSETGYNTSIWINQEVALAAYLHWLGKKAPCLILYEEGTNVEGLIKYTIANPKKFKSEEDIFQELGEWINNNNFSDQYSKRSDFIREEVTFFKTDEEKEFKFVSGKLNKDIEVEFELLESKDGQISHKIGIEKFRFNFLQVAIFYLNKGYNGFNRHNFRGEICDYLRIIGFPEQPAEGKRYYGNGIFSENVELVLQTYALIGQANTEFYKFSIAGKFFRFKYWLEVNNFLKEKLDFLLVK